VSLTSFFSLPLLILHHPLYLLPFFLFFFNDPSTSHIHTLSLHDALPISLPLEVSISLSTSLFWSLTDLTTPSFFSFALATCFFFSSSASSKSFCFCSLDNPTIWSIA